MELTQLVYFLAVARHQHLTRASEDLAVTQPALSHAISKLEKELGVPLFERVGRNVKVNRYGEIFARRIERVMQELEAGKHEIAETADPETGIISLSYLNILGVDLIPNLVREYQRLKPKVRFELIQGNLDDIHSQLVNGYSDLTITSKESGIEDCEWMTMKKVPLFIVVPAAHRYANRPSLSLLKLNDEPFIGIKNNCGLKATLQSRFQHTGFSLTSTYDAEDLITVAGFISAGLGVSVLPHTAGLALDGLVWLPIEEEGWVWEIGAMWKKYRFLSPATRQFLQFATGTLDINILKA
ncbi:LysR family transcriptional regulator [Paenibacillus agricola]|uniref:LysR family transcriptional regulator n=1 Tax=Paenibacillus agricola TaxID=2716264 RepID=A0ABX0JH02_9BACL|nr:LysR family transcriptional regulator [Paenibacillus agricola]NHN34182.1 LysR family transcriptional regulator [Paenibacillus agricola]